ncbi:MAG: hypothetical protein HQL74_07290 [Magnetococcales bacterium]|nr:hypothetical protein [Magnetococcales bacterium]
MSKVKISQIPDATSVTGAEEIPILQGGATKAVTIDTIRALGRCKQVYITGRLTTLAGTSRWYPPENITVSMMTGWVGVAPTGANLIFKLLKNGSIIATCTITASAYTSDTASGIASSLTPSDYLTLDITQVGTTVPGTDLGVRISY